MLARGYRHRAPSLAALARAGAAVAGLPPSARALDAGAGRGDHAAVWAGLGYRALALDPAAAMVDVAAGHTGVSVVRGRAQSMPFRDRSVSLVYFHLSLHYGDWRASIDEAARVSRAGGRCIVWTLGEAHHRSSMLARWFPSVADIDARRFPAPSRVAARLENLGLDVRRAGETEVVTRKAGEWTAAVRAGFVSTLQLVPVREREAGLDAFTAAHPDPEETISYELRWDQIWGGRR